MIWNLRGTAFQNAIVNEALNRCDFDYGKLAPSLWTKENKTHIAVEWADLSRYAVSNGEGHEHVHDGDALAHTVVREVDGRKRVLGLFYLPPYTKIVLDTSLVNHRLLAQEVFLAEGAHAVDYHYMTNDMRRQFVNQLHTQQLPPGADCSDGVAFQLDGHRCSWFDVGAYADWCGEALMEGFIEATSDVPVTIQLNHPVGPEDRAVIRRFLDIDPEPVVESEPEPPVEEPEPPVLEPEPEAPADETDEDLEEALRRYLGTKSGARSPRYLRDAAEAWLALR